jgi:hypothetical protein
VDVSGTAAISGLDVERVVPPTESKTISTVEEGVEAIHREGDGEVDSVSSATEGSAPAATVSSWPESFLVAAASLVCTCPC